jgi:cation diffusion facilitator CzcD-associated flavoprotein CzcO/pimeloyl-ACP methyl ester carboxylesterase
VVRRPAGGDAVTVEHVRVAVIGTGFGGLGAGVKVAEAGIDDFVILERADGVGGTWRDNTYPGCACDVPSQLYSFSFALNPEWTHSFSRQPEILAYLEGIAERYHLRPHIRFGCEVTEARWDGEAACWRLQTSRGPLAADLLVSAAGPLAEPATPDVPGIESFPGTVFHSARWDHGAEIDGRRVAVIGTGASAIQIVPEVQRRAATITLFQRTPAWVLPRTDRRYRGAERWLYRHVPAARRLARLSIYAARESYVPAFTRQPALLATAQRLAEHHLAAAVADPALRAALTPDYVMGCKRILLSNDYYPALTRGNVEVVASALASVEGDTVIAADGTARRADAIIFATGFHAVDLPIAERVYGADGRSLAQVWGDDMRALRGTTIAGFPNLCLVVGPNTGVGHTSMVHIIESQLAYVTDYLRALDGHRALDARAEAEARWNGDLQARLSRTVWARGGCRSWYLNAAGRNPTLWPGTTLAFRRQTRRVDRHEYHFLGEKGAEMALHPSSPRTLRIPSSDGVTLHAEIRGRPEAPTVVLVHGWSNSTRVWEPVMRALGDEFRVVTYDQRGHGRSDTPAADRYSVEALVDDLAAVLDATLPGGGEAALGGGGKAALADESKAALVGGGKAVLVGHSMGGMTIMAAGRRPAVVARTAGALLASTGFGDLVASARVFPSRPARLAAAAHRHLLRSAAPLGPANRLTRAALRYGTMGRSSPADMVALNASLVHACNRRSRGAWGRVLETLEVGDGLAGLDVPVHVLVGSADRLTPPVHAYRIAERLPHGTGVTELAGVGHMTPLEAPEVVADLIRKLVAESRVAP